MKSVPKTLRLHRHPVDLAFAVTDFKLQGKTMDELLLSIAPRPFPPHLDLKGAYVMVSRVRTRKRLRVLHKPSRAKGSLDSLLRLRHTPELKAWNDGYNENGDWMPSELAAQRKAEPAKRRRITKGPE